MEPTHEATADPPQPTIVRDLTAFIWDPERTRRYDDAELTFVPAATLDVLRQEAAQLAEVTIAAGDQQRGAALPEPVASELRQQVVAWYLRRLIVEKGLGMPARA